MTQRLQDLQRFYAALERLERAQGKPRLLRECHGRLRWPSRGVYFFFEPNEMRTDSGTGSRVVRVGTHALKTHSKSTLWSRLRQHRGNVRNSGGNHRGSIFRLLIGQALISAEKLTSETWGIGQSAVSETRKRETEAERVVTERMSELSLLWLPIEDDPGPQNRRGFVERNSIALLSNFHREALDPPSSEWLGRHSDRPKVRESGLWNSDHVDEHHTADFLDTFEQLVLTIETNP